MCNIEKAEKAYNAAKAVVALAHAQGKDKAPLSGDALRYADLGGDLVRRAYQAGLDGLPLWMVMRP